jgi:hypothetical protein
MSARYEHQSLVGADEPPFGAYAPRGNSLFEKRGG